MRSCVIELQEFERGLEPSLPKGEDMADAYLAFLLYRCSRAAGRVLVAEVDQVVVGFVVLLARVEPEEPDEDQMPYAYISDLVVLPQYRRRGIGRALLDRAEALARSLWKVRSRVRSSARTRSCSGRRCVWLASMNRSRATVRSLDVHCQRLPNFGM